jgi:hypothetical protein
MRKPPGIDGRAAWRMSCRLKSSVPFPAQALIFRKIRYQPLNGLA